MPITISVFTALNSLSGSAKKHRIEIMEWVKKSKPEISQNIVDTIIGGFIAFIGEQFQVEYSVSTGCLETRLTREEERALEDMLIGERQELYKHETWFIPKAIGAIKRNMHMYRISSVELNNLDQATIKIILDKFMDYYTDPSLKYTNGK